MKYVGPARSPFQGDLGRWCRPTGSDADAAPRQNPLVEADFTVYGVKAHLCRSEHASCGQMKHVGPVRSPYQGDLGRWCRPTGSDAAAAQRQKPLWTLFLQCMYVYVSYVCLCICMYVFVYVCIVCICMYCMY